MRCQHCHLDSDEPCVPDDGGPYNEAFDRLINDLDEIRDLSVEEIEDLYAAADANATAEADDDDYEIVRGPFDLSNEESRVYHFFDGQTVTIDYPDELYISESGDHLITAEGDEVGFVVAPGWTHYEIFPRFGQSPFEFGE